MIMRETSCVDDKYVILSIMCAQANLLSLIKVEQAQNLN